MGGVATGGNAPADERLRNLDINVQKTRDAYHALRVASRTPIQAGLGVTDELAAYYADVLYRRIPRDREREKALTVDVLEAIQEEGYRLVPIDVKRPDAGLKIVSDEREESLEAARKSHEAAKAIRNEFATEHASELARLTAERPVQRFREALAGDDPEALARALNDLPDVSGPRNVLTTDDVPAAA